MSKYVTNLVEHFINEVAGPVRPRRRSLAQKQGVRQASRTKLRNARLENVDSLDPQNPSIPLRYLGWKNGWECWEISSEDEGRLWASELMKDPGVAYAGIGGGELSVYWVHKREPDEMEQDEPEDDDDDDESSDGEEPGEEPEETPMILFDEPTDSEKEPEAPFENKGFLYYDYYQRERHESR